MATSLAARCRELRTEDAGRYDVRSARRGGSGWVYWLEPSEEDAAKPGRLAPGERARSDPGGTRPEPVVDRPPAPLFDVPPVEDDEDVWNQGREGRNARARRRRQKGGE